MKTNGKYMVWTKGDHRVVGFYDSLAEAEFAVLHFVGMPHEYEIIRLEQIG